MPVLTLVPKGTRQPSTLQGREGGRVSHSGAVRRTNVQLLSLRWVWGDTPKTFSTVFPPGELVGMVISSQKVISPTWNGMKTPSQQDDKLVFSDWSTRIMCCSLRYVPRDTSQRTRSPSCLVREAKQ